MLVMTESAVRTPYPDIFQRPKRLECVSCYPNLTKEEEYSSEGLLDPM